MAASQPRSLCLHNPISGSQSSYLRGSSHCAYPAYRAPDHRFQYARNIPMMLPVVGLRLPEGRVGSTLLMEIISSSAAVATDRSYPIGERRYLSYCAKSASYMAGPWREGRDPGVTEMFFGDQEPFGPLPFNPQALDRDKLAPEILRSLWEAFSRSLLTKDPSVTLYAEKLAVPVRPLLDAEIPLRIIDCVRDPRDVLASIRAFSAKTGNEGFSRRSGEPEARYMTRFLERFAAKLDDMEETPADTERIVIRYEDLVMDIGTVAARLGDWLGLRLDASVGERFRSENPNHLTTDTPEESVGQWKHELTTVEADSIWAALGPKLLRYGYT